MRRIIKKLKDEKAIISLEASIVLPMFILIMMFLYGFMVFFTGQNTVQHALIQTAESLSLDSYAGEKINGTYVDTAYQFIADIFDPTSGEYFASTEKWYEDNVPEEVKKRFLGFLANGDEDIAEKILNQAGIEGGIDAIDFSDSTVNNGILTIIASFEQKFVYDFQGLGVFPRTFTVKQDMWGLD